MCPVALGMWGAMDRVGEQWRGKERLGGCGTWPMGTHFPDQNGFACSWGHENKEEIGTKRGNWRLGVQPYQRPRTLLSWPQHGLLYFDTQGFQGLGPLTQAVAGRARLSSWDGCWLYQGSLGCPRSNSPLPATWSWTKWLPPTPLSPDSAGFLTRWLTQTHPPARPTVSRAPGIPLSIPLTPD